ncbi:MULTISPECIES: sensor histidine kinase [Catenuloplanes]|uniref:histidine kinase n=1 Tax=Catenuloplanes niger TaxID=587534 RepID=A0AAE4CSN1_9ACTN|nr:sensor histidine kinase [Catenuloplanes niger]MDR7323200.1 signal transduction histidine kinase [Catenuloplanes niger]
MSEFVLLRMALRREHDIFVIRQRGREVAAAVGLEHQDQIRLATALSDVARLLLPVPGDADVAFVALTATPPRLVVEIVAGPGAAAMLKGGPAGRLVHSLEVDGDEHATRVRLVSRLPIGAVPLTEEHIANLRREVAANEPGTPLDELAVQNRELMSALEEVRAQRDELAETNQGVMALYNELSQELEETNRGVVALYNELDEKSAQLKAASEAKSRFLANVSHELRAPVTAVIGLTRLLADSGSDPLTDEQTRHVDLIRGSATDLLTLVNDLLDLAKAEAGRLEPVWTDVDLRALFGQLRGTARAIITRPGVGLVVEDPPTGSTLTTDEALLAQVLRNLLTNAIKFTERGTVSMSLRAATGQDGWEIEVADTGIGIPPELHERIFEEFYQVPGSSVGRTGTGLGLPYAQRLVTLLGGSLRLSSEPGKGSVFTVVLPRRPMPPAPAQRDEG